MTTMIIGCESYNNGGDGIRIEGRSDVFVYGCKTAGNGGKGVNVLPASAPPASAPAEPAPPPKRSWHERPAGALALGLLAGVSVEALKRGLGLP